MSLRLRFAQSALLVVAWIVPSIAQTVLLPPDTVTYQVENASDRYSVVVLRDGTRFETRLHEVAVLAALQVSGKQPYLVMRGVGCTGCDSGIAIYLHSPSDGEMENEARQPRYVYPGPISDWESGGLVAKSRLFIGDCLAEYPGALIWFMDDRGENGRWVSSLYILQVKSENLIHEERVQVPADGLARASEAAFASTGCIEVPGWEQFTEP